MEEKLCYICGLEGKYIFQINKDRKKYVCEKCKKKFFKKIGEDK